MTTVWTVVALIAWILLNRLPPQQRPTQKTHTSA